MSFPNPPSNPQIDLTGPLAPTLQSYVLFDGTAGLPRNVVNNALPRRWAGIYNLNFGEDALWQPGAFTPDTTASSILRFATNSKSLAYPYGGVGASTIRSGNSLSYTMFAMFCVDAIDFASTPLVITGNGGPVYGASGSPFLYDGIAVVAQGTTANLAWYNPGFPALYNTDSSGNTLQCPIVAGHWYFASIAVSYQGDSFMRYYLYDLTAGSLISPTGTQYFNGGFGPQTNARYGNWNSSNVVSLGDHYICPGLGGVARVRMAGIDNQIWGPNPSNGNYAPPSSITSLGYADIPSYMIANPYRVLTSTVNTAGSPATNLANGSSNQGSAPNYVGYAYSTQFVAASTESGAPSTLPLVAIGDAAITQVNQTSITFNATPPLGAPHAIATWKLYGTLSYPPNQGEAALVTSSTMPITYSPPDTKVRWYQITATDSVGTVYSYGVMPGNIRAKRALRFMLGGNSILTTTGSVYSGFLAAGAVANYFNFDLAITTQADDGAFAYEWYTNTQLRSYFADGLSAQTTQVDYYLLRAAMEKTATGNNVDAAILQLSGNDSGTTVAQYQQIISNVLTGTGVLGSYTPATNAVYLTASPLQLAGHPLFTDADILIGQNANQAGAVSPPTSQFEGIGAQLASVVYQYSYQGQHPNAWVASIEGAGWMLDYLFATGVINSGGGVSGGGSYTFAA